MELKDVLQRYGGKFSKARFAHDLREAVGSGKTELYILDSAVVKVFDRSVSIENELNALRDIKSEHIIKVLYAQQNPVKLIVYERIVPLKNISSPNKRELIKQLCNIAIALLDIHSAGYTHGDVAIGNIGLNKSGNYVLYDFEGVRKDDSAESRYKDVEMFLEDFKYQYKAFPELYALLSDLLAKLETHKTKSVVQKRMPSGRTKDIEVFTYSYKPEDFGVILMNLCNV